VEGQSALRVGRKSSVPRTGPPMQTESGMGRFVWTDRRYNLGLGDKGGWAGKEGERNKQVW